MALLIKSLVEGYGYTMRDLPDPASRNLPLMASPVQTIFIIISYLFCVKVIGPAYMKNRKAYNLDKFMIAYNVFQILTNFILFYLAIPFVTNTNPMCNVERKRIIELGAYFYYALKIIDLIDTMIFVLRKKENQITFLHLFHHSIMIFGVWIGVKYVPYGHSTYLVFINNFVHTIMYSYYLLTIWRTDLKQSVWWKKNLTQLQLFQFILLVVIYSLALFNRNCDYPKVLSALIVIESILMMVLFGNFYYKAYIKK